MHIRKIKSSKITHWGRCLIFGPKIRFWLKVARSDIWIFALKIRLKILGFQFYGFKNSQIFEFSRQKSDWKSYSGFKNIWIFAPKLKLKKPQISVFWVQKFTYFINLCVKNDFCELGCQKCCDWILQVGIWLLIVSNFFVPFINWEEKEWNWLENDEWDLKNISPTFS